MRYLFIPLFLTACAAERQPGELFGSVEKDNEFVVDGVLIVDQPLPELFVWRILPPGQTYDREAAGVSNAQVRILQEDQVFKYAPDSTPGRYLPPPEAPLVQPLAEYRLEVEVEGKIIRASTATPEQVRVLQAALLDEDTEEIVQTLKLFAEVGDEVYTAPENQLAHLKGLIEIQIEKAGETYQAALVALEEDAQLLDEELPDIYDREAEDLRTTPSQPLTISDGILRWPWFSVIYDGRSLLKVYAVDYNWFEYIRSSPEQQDEDNLGELLGDYFERPLFQVEGGIGLFGSASVDSVGFVVLPRQTESSD